MSQPANSLRQRSCGNKLAHARELIATSRSFKELQKVLNNSGYELDNIEDVICFAKYAWWESNEFGPQEAAKIPSFSLLPGKEVIIDNIHYYVHGIVHESPISGVIVAPELKNYISNVAETFHQSKERTDYVYESGLDSSFSLHPANSMDDFIGFSTFFSRIESDLPNNLNKNTQESCRNLEWAKKRFCYEPAEMKLKTELQRGLKKIEDLIFIRAICQNYFLPPPLSIEEKTYHIQLLEQLSNLNTNYESLHIIRTLSRSKYMAHYMHTYAKQNALENLHALVGLAHESEIAFFLTEYDYVI